MDNYVDIVRKILENPIMDLQSPITNNVCPSPDLIFKVFKEMSPKDTKVIIIGQDPYPKKGVAIGRAFGVAKDTPSQLLPPSLVSIMDSIAISVYNDPFCTNEDFDITLESWQKQGVMLLNASLTCNVDSPEDVSQLFKQDTHSYYWRLALMERLIEYIDENQSVIFALLGKKAQYYEKFIKKNIAFICPHPMVDYYNSSNDFIKSNVFNRINTELEKQNKTKIIW